MDAIKKEIEQLSLQEERAIGPAFAMKSRLEQLTEQYEETNNKIDEETLTQATYNYVKDRLERDFIATKLKTAELEASLKSKKSILELEHTK